MIRQALVLLGVSIAGVGCACGRFEISGTSATNYEGDDYNGGWTESCGMRSGSTGVWNMMGDGIAEIWFSPDASGGRSWMAIDIEMLVGFANSQLKPGTTIELDEMYGGAALNPCIDCPQDQAVLTEGSIEVLSGWEGTDPCEPDDGPDFKLRWELSFEGQSGEVYTATGKDRIQFSTFTDDTCSPIY